MTAGITNNNPFANYATKLDANAIQKIKDMAKDGISAEEKNEIKTQYGINDQDLEAIADLKEGDITKFLDELDAKNTPATTKTPEDVSAKVTELQAKYTEKFGGGDPYSSTNKQLTSLDDAVNKGLLSDLAKEGFSKSQIIDIIGKTFDSTGIRTNGDKGGYNIPYGHDAKGKEIYKNFQAKLVEAMNGTAAAGTAEQTAEMAALKDAITADTNQIESNNKQIAVLQQEIEKAQKQFEEAVAEGIQKQKDISEEAKQDSENTVSAWVNKFASGQITEEEFQAGLHGDLAEVAGDAASNIEGVVADIAKAQGFFESVTGLLSKIKDLGNQNKQLQQNIQTNTAKVADLQKAIDAAAAAAKESSSSSSVDPDAKCCDPIGFEANGARYDFFIDKDGNGDLSNENEFLGAQNGWAAMEALDTDGDGKISKAELEGAENLKMVKTNADGTQEIVDIKDVFANAADDANVIDLSTYTAKGTKFGDNNENTLLGTFEVDLDGLDVGEDAIEGYNTLDDINWLDQNYDFSDKNEGVGRFAKDVETQQVNPMEIDDFLNEYDAIVENDKKLLDYMATSLEYNREDLVAKLQADKKSGESEGASIQKTFDDIKLKEEAQFEKRAKEAAAKEEAATTEEVAAEEDTPKTDETAETAKDYNNLTEEEVGKLSQDEINNLTDEQLAKYNLKKITAPTTEA